jgi:hypothetical protein
VERFQIPLLQVLPLGEDPLVNVAGEQLARVKGEGLGEEAGAVRGRDGAIDREEGGVEGGSVGVDIRVEGESGAVGHEEGVGGGAGGLEGAAEGVERDAEAVPAGVRVDAGPEPFHQLVARGGAMAIIGHVGEQGAGSLRLEARDDHVAMLHPQPFEKLDPPALAHGSPPRIYYAAGADLMLSRVDLMIG